MTRFPKPPKPMLEHLYAEHRQTLHEIATLYGCSYQTVHRWMKAEKIHPPRLSKWTLVTLYCDQRLSSRQIAAQTGYSFGTILRWLRKHKIPVRKTTTREHRPSTFGDAMQYCQRHFRIVTRILAQRTGIDAARLTHIKRQTVIPTTREKDKICQVLRFTWNDPIEIDESAVLRERMTQHIPSIIATITQRHGRQSVQDTMPCPVCQKTLYYGISALNGHTWGCCETKGCIGWIE